MPTSFASTTYVCSQCSLDKVQFVNAQTLLHFLPSANPQLDHQFLRPQRLLRPPPFSSWTCQHVSWENKPARVVAMPTGEFLPRQGCKYAFVGTITSIVDSCTSYHSHVTGKGVTEIVVPATCSIVEFWIIGGNVSQRMPPSPLIAPFCAPFVEASTKPSLRSS